jgi:hypothetical protein
MDKITTIINEIISNGVTERFKHWGKNNPRESERQLLYGDVMDYLRDNYNELNLTERDFVAHHLIGHYVITNALL